MIDKIKKTIFENKIFVIVMIIGYILLFIQMNQVVLYADDFSLGIYAKPDAQINIFQYFKHIFLENLFYIW